MNADFVVGCVHTESGASAIRERRFGKIRRMVGVLLVGAALVPGWGCSGPNVSATVPTPMVAAAASIPDPMAATREQQLRDLASQLDQERAGRVGYQSRAAQQQAEIESLRQELARTQAALKKAEGASQEGAGRINEYQRTVAALQAQLADLQSRPALPPPPPVAGPGVVPADVGRLLREVADKNGLVFDERNGMLRLPGDLLFASGDDRLTPSGAELLRKLCPILDRPEIADYRIRVVGHTDRRPISNPSTARQHPTNWHLSADRAIAVIAELIHMARAQGANATHVELLKRRCEAVGCGQQLPLDGGNSEAAHRRNRRVEIYLVPPTGLTPAPSLLPATAPTSASTD